MPPKPKPEDSTTTLRHALLFISGVLVAIAALLMYDTAVKSPGAQPPKGASAASLGPQHEATTPDKVTAVCDAEGRLTLSSSSVAAQPDGIHIEVIAQKEGLTLSTSSRRPENIPLPLGKSSHVVDDAPGLSTIACLEPEEYFGNLDETQEIGQAQLTINDAAGYWVGDSSHLNCPAGLTYTEQTLPPIRESSPRQVAETVSAQFDGSAIWISRSPTGYVDFFPQAWFVLTDSGAEPQAHQVEVTRSEGGAYTGIYLGYCKTNYLPFDSKISYIPLSRSYDENTPTTVKLTCDESGVSTSTALVTSSSAGVVFETDVTSTFSLSWTQAPPSDAQHYVNLDRQRSVTVPIPPGVTQVRCSTDLEKHVDLTVVDPEGYFMQPIDGFMPCSGWMPIKKQGDPTEAATALEAFREAVSSQVTARAGTEERGPWGYMRSSTKYWQVQLHTRGSLIGRTETDGSSTRSFAALESVCDVDPPRAMNEVVDTA